MDNDSNDGIICRVTERVVIRKFRQTDAAVYASYATDDRVWNTMSDRMPHPYSVEDARSWIEHTQDPKTFASVGNSLEDEHAEKIPTMFVIVVDDQPCGGVQLIFHEGVYRLNATIGYWLGAPYQRTGIMTKTIPAFVAWTWKTFGYLNRLNGTAYETNVGSQMVMKSAGFKHESVRINACIKNGVICNEVTLAALRPDSV